MSNPFSPWLTSGGRVWLDGGLGTELERRGHTQLGRLWSAALVRTNPAALREVHHDYLEAGACVVTSATFQASVPTIRQTGLHRAEAEELLRDAVALASLERDLFVKRTNGQCLRRPLVAASIGPLGAARRDGSEYTGNYGQVTEKQLISFHLERWRVLAESEADVLACETIPSFLEVLALLKLLAATPQRWAWLSLMCRDARHLADGTPLREVLLATQDVPNLCAVGVNCLPPSMAAPTLETLIHYATAPLIVYPNASETWFALDRQPGSEVGPEAFAQGATAWRAAGAQIIGGCCRTQPAHIRALSGS